MKRRWEPGALPNRQPDSSKRLCKRKSSAPDGAIKRKKLERIFSGNEPLTLDSVRNAVPHKHVCRKRKHDEIADDKEDERQKAGNVDSAALQQPPLETHGNELRQKEDSQDTATPQEFTAFNFWRIDLPMLPPEELNVPRPGDDAVERMDHS